MDHQGALLLIRQKSTTNNLSPVQTPKMSRPGSWSLSPTIDHLLCEHLGSFDKKPTVGETSNLKGSRRPHLWTKSWATPVRTIMFMFGCWVGVPSCDWKLLWCCDDCHDWWACQWWIIFSLFRCTSWKMLTRQTCCFWENTRLFSRASC